MEQDLFRRNYGTRPYRIAGEGPTTVTSEQFNEKSVTWISSDF